MLTQWLTQIIVLLPIVSLTIGCQSTPPQKTNVTIAVHYPKTGRWYPLGKQTLLTAKMAQAKYENQLKDAGLDVHVKAYEYDFTDHKKQLELSKQMANDPDLLAVISYMDYDFSKYKLPLLTWNQRSEILENNVNTIFRLSLSDTIRQKIATWYLANSVKAKNVVIVLDGESFSLNYQHSLRDRLREGNLTVLTTLTAKAEDPSSIKKATEVIKSHKPDAIIHVGSGLQQAMNKVSLNLKSSQLDIPTLCLVDYPPETIPEGLKFQYISLFDARTGTKKDMDQLLKTFKKNHHEFLGGIGIYAYEASQLIFSALLSLRNQSKEIQRSNLIEELRKTHFTGITGLVTYNDIGDRTTGEFIIGQRTTGKYKLLQKGSWPLKPKER